MSKLCKIISILSSIVGLLAVGLGLMIKMRAKRDVMAASIAIIGGADGPTSIFVAGEGQGEDPLHQLAHSSRLSRSQNRRSSSQSSGESISRSSSVVKSPLALPA